MIIYKDKEGVEHDFDAVAELDQMNMKPISFDSKNLIIHAEDPGGQKRQIDIGGYINAVNKSTGNSFKIVKADSLNNPEDAIAQQPDGNFWRRIKLGFGDEKGKINYLKKTFADAKVTEDGTLVVNDRGLWKRIDPKGIDPGDFADMAAYIPNVALTTIGEIGGGFAGLAAGPGAPAAVPAGIIGGGAAGGAVGEAARQGVGKLIGVQSAMDPKEIALQGAISGAGAGIGVGAGVAAKALKKPAQKAVEGLSSTITGKVGPKMTSTLTGINKELAEEAWKNPAKVFTKTNLDDKAMLEAGKKAQRALSIMKAAGQREYKMATKDIMKHGDKIVNTAPAAKALKEELIRDGLLAERVKIPGAKVSYQEFADVMTAAGKKAVKAGGKVSGKATDIKIAPKIATKTLPRDTLATDATGQRVLMAVYKKIKGGTMSVREYDKLSRQINQILPAYNEVPKISSPNIGKLKMIKGKLNEAVGKVVPGFTERNKSYAEAMDLYNRARTKLGDEKLEGFFSRLFTTKNKEAVKEVFDELNTAVPKGAKFMPKVKQVQAAKEFARILPAGNMKELAERSIPSAAAYGASRFGIVPPWLSFVLAASQSPVVHKGAIKTAYGMGSAALKSSEVVGKALGGKVSGGAIRQTAVRAAMQRRLNKKEGE
ncbi:MAG TPA: hypothetical protein P5110_07545 [Candidatus Omnitrophota bacterium]|nr:hypothetical protein [Candidatus Omnitrophota bacterium]